MLKNKDQILEKMPKNGQVTVLLFREGDKVNVYHVLEKPDGSFSPISNDHSPLSTPEHHIHEDIAQSNARFVFPYSNLISTSRPLNLIKSKRNKTKKTI